MAQRSSRTERLFGRTPSDVPEWMAIRDADAKRRNDNQAKLRAARLARDAALTGGSAEAAATPPHPKRSSRKKAKP